MLLLFQILNGPFMTLTPFWEPQTLKLPIQILLEAMKLLIVPLRTLKLGVGEVGVVGRESTSLPAPFPSNSACPAPPHFPLTQSPHEAGCIRPADQISTQTSEGGTQGEEVLERLPLPDRKSVV